MTGKTAILENRTSLGIELGSTRIKAVLIDESGAVLAAGSHDWENRLENGIWTYHLPDVWTGVRACYAALKADVAARYAVTLSSVGSLGLSGMMHGYLAFDQTGELLVPFRTWRNTMTARASEELTALFSYPIPHRWSIAHLYEAILKEEPHVGEIRYLTTLAGYLHWCLTGKKVLGIGDASGMFPIDSTSHQFDRTMLAQFEALVAGRGFPWRLSEILPTVLSAGAPAGTLTPAGCNLLDPTGDLISGIPLCPPEGDAGTGMVATNSVAPRTGNVSAGTSIFLMAVLEKPLRAVHPELDLVTTPAGDLVAMVHCNNGTGEVDAWATLFSELLEAAGTPLDKSALYSLLYHKALEGAPDCGGLLSYNYHAGESITGLEEGRPLLARMPSSSLTLGDFMRTQLYAVLATLRIGFDILVDEEQIRLDQVYGHGGFFKTPRVGPQMMAAALDTPVTVLTTAGEGGPWGMAVLAAYMVAGGGKSLPDYLREQIFAEVPGERLAPNPQDVAGFDAFMKRYRAGLLIERAAVEALPQDAI